MDRATRFLWERQCGRKDRKLFQQAMRLLCDVIQQTSDLTLLTDGERRYGSLEGVSHVLVPLRWLVQIHTD